MLKKLIVNADDYGRTKNVSKGIRQAHGEGIVSTTTVMMNLPGALEAVRLAKVETPALGLGVHLNLTFGEPLSPEAKVTSITDAQGGFRSKDFYFYHSDEITGNHVEYEWRMQIEAFLNCGVVLDHLDSHHHIALASPEFWYLSLRLAKEYGCGVRLPNPTDIPDEVLRDVLPNDSSDFVRHYALGALDEAGIPHPNHFISSFFGSGVSLDHLSSILHSLPEGISELMCHPGFVDEELCATSGYAKPRQKEYEILTNPKIVQLIQKSEIVLTTFQEALA
jgi:chitin disaccharide deacetylase